MGLTMNDKQEYIWVETSEKEENIKIPEILQEPTQEERLEAQVLYTALMTDTLLEE